MEKSSLFLIIFATLFYTIIFLGSCANQISPAGGPRDTLRPFLINSIPKNQSLNFRGKLIVLEFNEWIKQNNIQQELIITPPFERYSAKAIRKRLEIKLDTALRENTTYNFNFRAAIGDITENNIAMMDTVSRRPLRIAFSTGSVIDSMSVQGNIKDLMSNKIEKDLLVALYDLKDTLEVDKDKPIYFTLTDTLGNFLIENIKAGEYRVFAVKDNNSNLMYDKDEKIAFQTTALQFSDTLTSINNMNLRIAKEDHQKPDINRHRSFGKYYEIIYEEGITDFEIKDSLGKFTFPYQIDKEGKTIKIYNTTEAFGDSLSVEVTALDSTNNQSIENIKIIFEKEKEDKKRKGRKEGKGNITTSGSKARTLNIAFEIPTGKGLEQSVAFNLNFAKPIKNYDFKKIKYWTDEDTLNVRNLLWEDSTAFYTWNKSFNSLNIQRPDIRLEEKITVVLDSLAFISVEQDTSKAQRQVIKLKDVSDFGSISGEVKTQAPHYIVQLLTKEGKVVAEKRDIKAFDFQYLEAGTYLIRVIIDENNNGKWDASDFKNDQPPEEVIFFQLQNQGRLKARWDIQGQVLEF